ncbi:MAG: cytochrome c3 family protein [bacterium]
MKRKMTGNILIFLIIVLVSGFPVAVGAASAQRRNATGTRIPTEVVMTVPEGEKNKKFAVPFPHAKHKGIDCTVCHHNAYETLIMNKCSAEGCHFNTRQREGTESFYAAFHGMFEQNDRSCLDCHKTRGKGPTACKDCHKKR